MINLIRNFKLEIKKLQLMYKKGSLSMYTASINSMITRNARDKNSQIKLITHLHLFLFI